MLVGVSWDACRDRGTFVLQFVKPVKTQRGAESCDAVPLYVRPLLVCDL